MPVRSRSEAWIPAMASLPPSRSARSSSSAASTPGWKASPSPNATGGRSTRCVMMSAATSSHGSQPSRKSRSKPAAPTRPSASPRVPSRDRDSPRWRSSRGFTREAAVLPARRSMSRIPSSNPVTSSRGIGLPDKRRHGIESPVDAFDRQERAPAATRAASARPSACTSGRAHRPACRRVRRRRHASTRRAPGCGASSRPAASCRPSPRPSAA